MSDDVLHASAWAGFARFRRGSMPGTRGENGSRSGWIEDACMTSIPDPRRFSPICSTLSRAGPGVGFRRGRAVVLRFVEGFLSRRTRSVAMERGVKVIPRGSPPGPRGFRGWHGGGGREHVGVPNPEGSKGAHVSQPAERPEGIHPPGGDPIPGHGWAEGLAPGPKSSTWTRAAARYHTVPSHPASGACARPPWDLGSIPASKYWPTGGWMRYWPIWLSNTQVWCRV